MIIGTATNYLTLSDALVAAATGNSLTTVTINSGGTGYTAGDILSVVGGTSSITATVEVVTVSSGIITAVRIANQGVYTANASTPNSATGGTGSGASLVLTFSSNGWVTQVNHTWSGSEKEVILKGTGGGTDSIYAGWRTFSNSGTGYYNWELHGMTGYSAGQSMSNQPGVSPGFHDTGVTATTRGAYLLLMNASMNYWFFITSYRIIVVVQTGTAYNNAYLGWGSRYGTSGEYPYPMVISGHTEVYTEIYNQSALSSGLCDPWNRGGYTANGPMFVRTADGSWYSVSNGTSGTNSPDERDHVVLPAGLPTGYESTGTVSPEDRVMMASSSCPTFRNIAPAGGTGTAVANLQPTGSDNSRAMFPTIVFLYLPSPQILMELTGVYWMSGAGSVNTGDRIILNNVSHRIFQNCNRTNNYSFLAIREV